MTAADRRLAAPTPARRRAGRRLPQPRARPRRGRAGRRDAARSAAADRGRRRPRRDDVRHRRGQHHGGHRARGRPGGRRRPDGPRQRRAQRRAGARPAAGPRRPRPGDALARAPRRGPHRRRRGRRRRSQPGGGRGRGARRAAGQGRPPVARRPRQARRRTPATSVRTRSSGSSRSRTPTACTPGRPPGWSARCARSTRRSSCATSTTGAGPVPAGSLSRVATLAALRGHEVEVRASGPQAQEAVEHLLALAERRFDETDRATPWRHGAAGPPASSAAARCRLARDRDRPGAPAHRGAGRPRPSTRWTSRRPSGGASCEAVAAVRREIEHVRVLTAREVGAEEAEIFDAHLSLLDRRRAARRRQGPHRRGRRARSPPGPTAWPTSSASGPSLPDPYLRERAADVRAVGDQVLRALTGRGRTADDGAGRPRGRRPDARRDRRPRPRPGDRRRPRPGQPDVARRHPGPGPRHPGRRGGRARGARHPRGHHRRARRRQRRAARRSLAGAARGVRAPRRRTRRAARPAARPGRAARGRPATATTFVVGRQPRIGRRRPRRARGRGRRRRPGPHRVPVPRPERRADIEEQQAEYDAIAEAMAGRRITLRTLDVGGDKPLPYLPMPAEANPFLGQRGIRLSLDHRDLLRDQMVAICHTARRLPDQHHDPDGVDARRDDRGPPGARPRRLDPRASRTACRSAR